jgi:hypothetical protein
MTTEDLETLRERYEALLRAYSVASRRGQDALGAKPVGSGPIPIVTQEWVDAVKEERQIEPEYIAARDAYWEAVSKQRGQ